MCIIFFLQLRAPPLYIDPGCGERQESHRRCANSGPAGVQKLPMMEALKFCKSLQPLHFNVRAIYSFIQWFANSNYTHLCMYCGAMWFVLHPRSVAAAGL